jgi:hypothetical protein
MNQINSTTNPINYNNEFFFENYAWADSNLREEYLQSLELRYQEGAEVEWDVPEDAEDAEDAETEDNALLLARRNTYDIIPMDISDNESGNESDSDSETSLAPRRLFPSEDIPMDISDDEEYEEDEADEDPFIVSNIFDDEIVAQVTQVAQVVVEIDEEAQQRMRVEDLV